MKYRMHAVAFAAAALALGQGAWAGEAEAKKWIDAEFQPSTLSKDQQAAEMKWFIEAAKKLIAKGVKEISVVSEKMIVWFGLEQEPSIWISFVVSMLLLGLVIRKG